MVIQGVNYPSDFEAKKEMIEIGRRMAEKKFAIAGDGSLSVRVGPNVVWMTAEGAEKGALKQDHFIRVDLNGKPMPGSRQARLPQDAEVHLQIYSQNPALRTVLHAYPMGAVALAVMGESVQPADYTPSVRRLGRMTLAVGKTAEEEAKAAVSVCKNDSGILFAGDGCMVWGESLAEAFHTLEALEYYAEIRRMLCPKTGAASETVFTGMDGLTPLVRPEAAGTETPFLLPETSHVAPQNRTFSGFQEPERPQPPVSEKRLQNPAISTEAAAAAQRETMMAEVVRRSLASLK